MLISALDLIKKSFELYKKNLEVFFIYSMLFFAPILILLIFDLTISNVFNLTPDTFVGKMYGGISFILFIIAIFVSLWFFIALTKVISERLENTKYGNFKEELIFAKHKLLSVFISSILYGLMVIVVIGLAIAPFFFLFDLTRMFIVVITVISLISILGLVLSTWFGFYIFASILDNQPDSSALKFSAKLVKGRWWQVLWRIFAVTFIYLILTQIALSPVDMVLDKSNSTIVVIVMALIGTVISAFFTPFMLSAQIILYNDLKRTRGITSPNT